MRMIVLPTKSPPHFSSSACLSPRRTDNLASEKTLVYFDIFFLGRCHRHPYIPQIYDTLSNSLLPNEALKDLQDFFLPRGKCHPAKRPSQAVFLCNRTSDSINPCPVQLPRQRLNCTDCCYCWPPHTCRAGVSSACVEIASDEEDLCAHEGRLRHKSYLLQTRPNATQSVIDLFTLTENK